MIYVNPHAEANDEEIHIWLEGMIGEEDRVQEYDEDGNEEGVKAHPSLGALCSVLVDDLAFPGAVQPHVKPANETWAGTLMDLLGDNRLCEECRTRAAVYFDRQDDVTLPAATRDVDECPECEDAGRDSYLRQAKISNIVQREDKTVVEREVTCDECGHEWKDSVDMSEL